MGRDLTTGNLYVENFATKKVDKVSAYAEIIKVDRNIQLYFKHYNTLSGFKYNKDYILTVINNQIVNTSTTRVATSATMVDTSATMVDTSATRVDTSATMVDTSATMVGQNPSFPIGPLHCNRMEVNEYQALEVDNSVEIRGKYEYLMNLSEVELGAYLSEDDSSTSSGKLDSNVDDTGNHRHASTSDHEMSKDIAVMVMKIMQEIIPNAADTDV